MAKKTYRNSTIKKGLSELFGADLPSEQVQPENSNTSYIKEVLADMEKEDEVKPEETESQETKFKLIPGETLIGEKSGIVQGDLKQISIYYGNYIRPMNIVNGKYVPLKKKEYLAILNAFLDSEEGKEYQRPTEQEIDDAFLEVKKVVNDYLDKHRVVQASGPLIQPGRTQAAPEPPQEVEETEGDKEGQPQEEVQEERTYLDDISTEEEKAVEFIRNKNYTRQQIKEIRKGLESEKRISSLATFSAIAVAVLILGFVIFLVRDIIIASFANIELELKQDSVTLKTGQAFNAPDYVKYVTDTDNVYIIYPTLDTAQIGNYELDYVATNNYKNVKKTLSVTVVDGIAPVIKLTKEEILLVRDRDEETVDLASYIETIEDNYDEDLKADISELDWEKEEQEITYTVKDSSDNKTEAKLLVKIEDKAVCDRNAIYNEESNTCTCKSGYRGDGTACTLIPVQTSTPAQTSSSGSSSSGSSGSSGSSSGGSSSSGSSGGSSSNPQPSPDPGPSGPYISASSVSVKVGASLAEVQAKIVSGISSSSGYWVDFSAVNTSVPGSYPVYIHGNDGAEGSCSVTVTE